MTVAQRTAQVFGIGFLVAAVAGFLASGNSMDPHVETAHRALGLFPVNVLHNLVHTIFGLWGLIASRSHGASKKYAMVSGVIYLLLAVLGYVAPDGFGLLPLGDNDILLHVFLGVPLAIIGFTAPEHPTVRARTTGATTDADVRVDDTTPRA